MSAFSQTTFNAVKYSASRPQYPPALYNYVTSLCHGSPTEGQGLLLDLGCGPGLSTFPLVSKFAKTIALDPSANMIKTTRQLADERGLAGVMECHQGTAEDLSMLEPQSVDLAIAAQAAHWFDAARVYKSLERVLKPGGSFAFWGYGEIFFPQHPKSTALLSDYSANKLGKYWQQPGRRIVEDLLKPFPLPQGAAWDKSSLRRTYFDLKKGSTVGGPAMSVGKQGESIEHRLVVLKHSWTFGQLEGYLSTWSSAHLYDAEHKGDVAKEFMAELAESLKSEGVKDETVECNWALAVLSARLTNA